MAFNVLILKGWVMGMYDKSWKEKVLILLNDIIISNHINIITWDGDLLKNDSYTQIIPDLMNQHSNLRSIIFKLDRDKIKLLSNYIEKDEQGTIKEQGYSFLNEDDATFIDMMDDYNMHNMKTIVSIHDDILVNDVGDIDYVQLGLEGYKYIKNKVANDVYVVRMGVGNVTMNENKAIIADNITYPNVKFIDIPTTRKLPGKEIDVFP